MRSVCLDDPLLPLLGYEHRFLSLYSTWMSVRNISHRRVSSDTRIWVVLNAL